MPVTALSVTSPDAEAMTPDASAPVVAISTPLNASTVPMAASPLAVARTEPPVEANLSASMPLLLALTDKSAPA